MTSTTLEAYRKQKRYFDLNSKTDIETYRQFLMTNSWGAQGCPFILEFPSLTVPDMIKDRLIRKFLKV
jgi:hypothetical protein